MLKNYNLLINIKANCSLNGFGRLIELLEIITYYLFIFYKNQPVTKFNSYEKELIPQLSLRKKRIY